MQDRVPTYPGRVRLTPVTGQQNVYDMTREDDYEIAGTPLNTANLLGSSAVNSIRALTGITPTVPTSAFSALANYLANEQIAKIEYGTYVGTGVYGANNKNRLDFNRRPVAFWLSRTTTNTEAAHSMIWITGNTTYTPILQSTISSLSSNIGTITEIIDTSGEVYALEWYSTGDEGWQFNVNGATYYYIALCI